MTWFVVVVLLVEGRGEVLDPPPGRAYLVGPTHTFADLAEAIDAGFARWDRQRPHRFDLPGDRHIGPPDAPLELSDETLLTVASELGVAERFTYVFDGEWFHRCHVEEAVPDPADVYGERPARPLPVDGWGTIPDQHGRQRRDPSPGRSGAASSGVVDLEGAWTGRETLRAAVGRGDHVSLVALLRDRPHVHDVLQLVGDTLLGAVEAQVRGAPEIVARCVASLRERNWEGDGELATALEGVFGAPVASLRPAPIGLWEVAGALAAADAGSRALDLETGGIVDAGTARAATRSSRESGRLLELAEDDGPYAPGDMVAFADQVADPVLAERLYAALDGAGAGRRFRTLVHEDSEVLEAWKAFSEERLLGRARAWLAAHGYRPSAPPPTVAFPTTFWEV